VFDGLMLVWLINELGGVHSVLLDYWAQQ
jgi:hypothetical protein